jgi:hypothetical protein
VYRLITCGTVEEKIYRKQVFKGGLSRCGTEQGTHFRYFSKQVRRGWRGSCASGSRSDRCLTLSCKVPLLE